MNKTCLLSLLVTTLLVAVVGACPASRVQAEASDGARMDTQSSSDAGSLDQDPTWDISADVVHPDIVSAADQRTVDAGGEDTAQGDAYTVDSAGAVPSGCIRGEFSLARGNLHSHTSYSDGVQTPADAFSYAHDVADLDILVVTDHLEQLYFVNPSDRWGLCRQQADAATAPGQFAAACGYEYGSGYGILESDGHCNVFFAEGLFPAVQLDFHDFYDTLVGCPSCIGQFNHPGDEESQHFEHFSYFADVDRRMNLFEFNGSGDTWGLFFQALDAGWHVSPTINQDNHGPDWGTQNDTRSGLYLVDLSAESIHEAMRNRRSFASFDKNASLRVRSSHGCWMGSILTTDEGFDLVAEAEDDDDGFANIDFWGPGRTLLQSTPCHNERQCQASYHFDVDNDTYVIAVALQSDNDTVTAAPIWVQGETN